jgi:type I restriction enzyme S subunit
MSWNEIELADVCEIGRGSSPRPINNKAYFEGGDIPWIKIADATSSVKVIYKTKEHVNSYGASFSRLLPIDSLIVAASGTLGFPMFLGVEGCIHDGWLYFKSYNGINKEFLYYKIIDLNKYFYSKAYGAAIQNINTDTLRRTRINLPPLETQKRIASILSAYDDLIENNLKRIKLLEETAQNIYKEWFVNFRFPNYEHTEFDAESGLPVGWEMKKLSDLVILTMGQSPKSEFYNENKEGLPFHQGVTGYGHRFVSHSTYCSVVTRIAEEGDILFSVRAPVGRLNIAPERLIIGRGLSSIRNKRNCQSFQLYQLKNHFFQEDLIGGGSIFNSVTKNDLENQLMISPLNEVEDEFERIVKPIDEQIWKLNLQNQNLKEVRDILLPRLMNRTIEV